MTKFNLFWTKNFQNGSLTNNLFFSKTRPHSSFNSNSTQTWLNISKKSKLRTRPYFQSSKIRKLRTRPYSKPTVTRSTHNSVKTPLAPLKPYSRHPCTVFLVIVNCFSTIFRHKSSGCFKSLFVEKIRMLWFLMLFQRYFRTKFFIADVAT